MTDQFCLIRSMSHPAPIANHFDAMHNMLSGQVVERVVEGESDGLPYIGSVVAKYLPSDRNLISNAWLIKCVGAARLVRRTSAPEATWDQHTRQCSSAQPTIIRRCRISSRRRFMTWATRSVFGNGGNCSAPWSPTAWRRILSPKIGANCERWPTTP